MKYSRLNRAELTPLPTDMDDVLTDVREMLETRIVEAGAEIRVPRDLPVVNCDRQQTAEILMNLISNAIKYNEEEQKIVEVGYLDEPPDAAPGEAGPVFYVSDNGIGIAEKYLDSIFGAFRRLHGRDKYGGGAGVGLAIVRKMVERQGGRIWVESEPGQGSTFYFTLGQPPAPSEPLSFAWPSEPDQGDSGGI
jgi:light-regulated signal transduction histidine kinase (bacteriophytochrome)